MEVNETPDLLPIKSHALPSMQLAFAQRQLAGHWSRTSLGVHCTSAGVRLTTPVRVNITSTGFSSVGVYSTTDGWHLLLLDELSRGALRFGYPLLNELQAII